MIHREHNMAKLKAVKDTPRPSIAKATPTVAEYLAHQISFCGRDQTEVARDCGYANPNVISMFKKGTTKLPLNKVGTMAKAIGADPAFLLRLVMKEYYGEAWDSILEILKAPPVSDNEAEILEIIRSVNGSDPAIPNDQVRDDLRAWAKKLPTAQVPQFARKKKS
jgi:hypothetical protein